MDNGIEVSVNEVIYHMTPYICQGVAAYPMHIRTVFLGGVGKKSHVPPTHPGLRQC